MSHALIYEGWVEHARFDPVEHRFRTPVHFYRFDVAKLNEVDRDVKGFGWNRRALVSLWNRDFLTQGTEAFQDKLDRWRDSFGGEKPARVTLVTSARWLGYVFNPVSFYLLETAEGELSGLVAEVNNTFGDRHVYAEPLEMQEGLPTASHDKEFHVSPFNNMDGTYQFTVRQTEDELYIGVDLYREGTKIIETWMEGKGIPLTTQSLRRCMWRHPLRPWLTMPRIVWQAVLLRFRRKLTVFERPEPEHASTLRSRGVPRVIDSGNRENKWTMSEKLPQQKALGRKEVPGRSGEHDEPLTRCVHPGEYDVPEPPRERLLDVWKNRLSLLVFLLAGLIIANGVRLMCLRGIGKGAIPEMALPFAIMIFGVYGWAMLVWMDTRSPTFRFWSAWVILALAWLFAGNMSGGF